MVKLYKKGNDFYQENKEILNSDPLRTVFFKLNYPHIKNFEKDNYAIKIETNNKILLALERSPFNLLIYGEVSLIKDLVLVIKDYNLKLNGILCEDYLSEAFILEYMNIIGGKFILRENMSILTSNVLNEEQRVSKAIVDDVTEIKQLSDLFDTEVFGEITNIKEEDIERDIDNYYLVKEKDEILSMAKITRNDELICSLSYVYTKKQYRGCKMARKVVTHITNKIVKEKKLAYLFVDNNNPISNHLYLSIGYKPLYKVLEYIYEQ